jgi:hypothetical protein
MARNRVEAMVIDWLQQAADEVKAGRWRAAAHAVERTLGVLRTHSDPASPAIRSNPTAMRRPVSVPPPQTDWSVRHAMNCSCCGSAPGGWHEEACIGMEY